MPFEVTDSVTLEGVRRTNDGYLVADAKIARSGIYQYGGSEVGRPDMPVVRVYRPEDAVFDERAMASFAHRPVTMNHPPARVTADNWKDYAVGMTGGEVARDGSFIRVPLVLMDGDAIREVEAALSGATQDSAGGSRRRELSCGYLCDFEFVAGQTPTGEAYDAIQRNIRGNHLAVVERGRAGSECRIGDGKPPAEIQFDGQAIARSLVDGLLRSASEPTRTSATVGDRAMPDAIPTVVVDGLTIPCTSQAVEVINRLQRQLGDAQSATLASDAAHKQALDALNGQLAAVRAEVTRSVEAKDGEIAALKAAHTAALEAKDGEVAALKASVPDATALDAMIVQRLATADAASKVFGAGFDPRGKSEADMRRMAVAKRLGDAAITGKSDDYVQAAFDTLLAQVPAGTPATRQADPLGLAIHAAAPPVVAPVVGDSASTPAFQKHLERLDNGWKTGGVKGVN